MPDEPIWPPPNMPVSHTPERSPPVPGTNPRYDELEDFRRRYSRLKEEARQLLGYHDARRLGLVSNLDFYTAAEAKIIERQLALLSAPASE